MTDFFTLMNSLSKTTDQNWHIAIPADWLQGRTAFGGLIAALAYRAMRHEVPAERKLITLDIVFIGPIAPGRVQIQTQTLRAGGYVTHIAADISDESGQPLVRASAVFGSHRESNIAIAPATPQPSMPREQGTIFPYIPGITPEFTRHFEYSLTEGSFPYSGASDAILGGFFRHKAPEQTEPSTTSANDPLEAAIALLDAWPPAVITMGKKPFAASTVRWTCHFLNDIPHDFNDHYWYRAEALAAQNGYATTTAQLVNNDVLIAWSEQLVAVFDA